MPRSNKTRELEQKGFTDTHLLVAKFLDTPTWRVVAINRNEEKLRDAMERLFNEHTKIEQVKVIVIDGVTGDVVI